LKKILKKLNSDIISNLITLLGIKITNFSEKYIDNKTVTFYTIEITSNITKNTWKIEKRYSEFKSIHDTLNKIYPNFPLDVRNFKIIPNREIMLVCCSEMNIISRAD